MENALGKIKIIYKYITIFALCVLLNACLVPNKYNAVLDVSSNSYNFEFIGELRMMLLYTDDYKSGSLNLAPSAEPLNKQIINEFKRVISERSLSFIEVEQHEPTVFRTSFAYTSSYAYPEASGLFNFKIEKNILTITSRHMNEGDRALIEKYNIPSRGTLCIRTLGKVLESNAQTSANAFNRCNTWNMENLDEGVRMVIEFKAPLNIN